MEAVALGLMLDFIFQVAKYEFEGGKGSTDPYFMDFILYMFFWIILGQSITADREAGPPGQRRLKDGAARKRIR